MTFHCKLCLALNHCDIESCPLAPVAQQEPPQPPGTWAALAAGLDSYHAANLLEALKIVPDTGDWHGSLRIACQMVLDRDGHPGWVCQTADQMRATICGTSDDRSAHAVPRAGCTCPTCIILRS